MNGTDNRAAYVIGKPSSVWRPVQVNSRIRFLVSQIGEPVGKVACAAIRHILSDIYIIACNHTAAF